MVNEIHILLVEDSPSDAKIMMRMLERSKLRTNLTLVRDGEAALAYLYKQASYEDVHTPDLVLLDLNLPKLSGFEVLEAAKTDKDLRVIPIVVLTTSADEDDVLGSYKRYANSYVTKPVNFEKFTKIVEAIDTFWFSIVKLPPKEG